MHVAEPAAMDFEAQPVLRGPTLCLRPLESDDQEPLWQAARDPLIWEQHPDKTRSDRAGFLRFFQDSLQSRGALAVVDLASDRLIGTSRFYDWDAARREIAIGYTFLVRQHWGGPANAEMKQLMIQHAARWAHGIWFHVATTNLRSRRAMEKLGARAMCEGKRPLNGALVDFVYYRIDGADVR
jgi:RimJ/RimL family protein N-acetyltransferase